MCDCNFCFDSAQDLYSKSPHGRLTVNMAFDVLLHTKRNTSTGWKVQINFICRHTAWCKVAILGQWTVYGRGWYFKPDTTSNPSLQPQSNWNNERVWVSLIAGPQSLPKYTVNAKPNTPNQTLPFNALKTIVILCLQFIHIMIDLSVHPAVQCLWLPLLS